MHASTALGSWSTLGITAMISSAVHSAGSLTARAVGCSCSVVTTSLRSRDPA
jgi:hypothetical protein